MPTTWRGKKLQSSGQTADRNLIMGPQQPRIKRKSIRKIFTLPEVIHFYAIGVGGVINESHSTNVQRYTIEELTDTVRNPKYKPFDNGFIADDGGEFLVRRSYWLQNPAFVNGPWIGNTKVSGQVWENFYSEFHDGISTSGDFPPQADIDAVVNMGTTAWNRFKPAKPRVQLGVFLAELRDLPGLLHARLANIKDIGDYYLAIQYGWKPLFSDIKKMINLVVRFQEQVAFLLTHAGKPVRRHGTLSHTLDSGVLWDETGLRMLNLGPSYLGKPALNSAWRQSSRWEKDQRIWFSGEFLFYFDDLRVPESPPHLAAALAGLRITPADIWDAIPWSWLIDWFSNIGDILHNMFDNVASRQVSQYAYIMGKTIRRYQQDTTDGYFAPSNTHVFECKVRRKVDPFGLASGTALTSTQLLILAALGIQRT